MSKATVVLEPESDGLRTYTAYTANDGKFSLEDVAPGRYRLTATRDGYFTAESASANPAQCGTLITLEANRRVADVPVAMMLGGAIAGRINESDGEAASNVTVQAIKYTYQNGNRVLTPVQSTKTNDLGEYRLFHLPPGRYLVAAALELGSLVGADEVGITPDLSFKNDGTDVPSSPATPPPGTFVPAQQSYRDTADTGPRLSPLYYPSTADPKTASPIEVRAGETFQGADMLVTRVEPRTIRGSIRNGASTDPFKRMSVYLVSRVAQPYGGGARSARVRLDGGFEISNILPGAYTLMAYGSDTSGWLIGRLAIDVVASDIENVELVVSRGLSLTGRVTTDNSQDMARIFDVSLYSISENRTLLTHLSLRAKVMDGVFTIEGIPPGKYMAYVSFMAPGNIYIKSMRLGSVDVRNGFSLDVQPAAPLDIAVGLNGAAVQGTVIGDSGQPLKNAAVVLVPDTFLRQRSSFYKFVTTDVAGGFVIPSIEPGDYKIFAWESVEKGAWEDPDFLRTYESRGQSMTLRETSRETVRITAFPSTGPVYHSCDLDID